MCTFLGEGLTLSFSKQGETQNRSRTGSVVPGFPTYPRVWYLPRPVAQIRKVVFCLWVVLSKQWGSTEKTVRKPLSSASSPCVPEV